MGKREPEVKTLDEVIAELEALRKIHGGEIEVVSTKGPISFRAFTFSAEEKIREGINDIITPMGDDGVIL